MKVLLTGHHGYIGSVMARHLVELGHEVTGLDSFLYRDCTFEGPEAEIPAVWKDIRDVERRDLAGFDAIVHLAALCNDPLGDLNEAWTYQINHEASVRLARLAKEAGARRFLYASSCSMYGAASGDDLLDEHAELKPLTAYAISKVRTEEDLHALAAPDFSPVYMRNATAYGASPRLRADVVLNNLVCWAYTTGKVRIMSDGTPWRPIVHIEDIAQAFGLVLASPVESTHDQAYNIGANGQNYQVKELADVVRAVVPRCEIEYSGQAAPDPRNYRVDFSKFATAFPAFRPRWDAKSGASQLYEACRRVGLTLDEFNGQKYIRLNRLRRLIENRQVDESLRWRAA